MNIISALRRSKETGERFTRPENRAYTFQHRGYDDGEVVSMLRSDLLADDWEPVEGTGDAEKATAFCWKNIMEQAARWDELNSEENTKKLYAEYKKLRDKYLVGLSPQAETLGQDKDAYFDLSYGLRSHAEASKLLSKADKKAILTTDMFADLVAASVPPNLAKAATEEMIRGVTSFTHDSDGVYKQPLPPPSPVEEVDVAWPDQAVESTVILGPISNLPEDVELKSMGWGADNQFSFPDKVTGLSALGGVLKVECANGMAFVFDERDQSVTPIDPQPDKLPVAQFGTSLYHAPPAPYTEVSNDDLATLAKHAVGADKLTVDLDDPQPDIVIEDNGDA